MNFKKITLSFLVIAGLTLTGCKSEPQNVADGHENIEHLDHHAEGDHDDAHHDDAHDDHGDHDDTPIELDGGEKWTINDEMRAPLADAQKILELYIQKEDTDYKSLGKALSDKNSELIKSCTMKGKSHNELHKWLEPHMELLDELNAAEDEDAANVMIAKLDDSFHFFHEYFQ